MSNKEIIINALCNQTDKRKKSIRFPQQILKGEVRIDTNYSIEFNVENLSVKEVRTKKNDLGVDLLYFITDYGKYNITWVDDESTKKILSYITLAQ